MVLLTGAAGFLGRAVAQQLLATGRSVRALVLPGDAMAAYLPKGIEVFYGDLLKLDDLARFFDTDSKLPVTVIHCAGLISMSMDPVDIVYQVNVQGTRNIIQQCAATGARLIHVASVHAIRELPHGQVMAEPGGFEPEQLVGYYAQTKAQAAQAVMEARQQGLQASIVYPAGLSGPGDFAVGNLSQLFLDYLAGSLPAGVKGGYNFADVRDVAAAIATLSGQPALGEDYVLAGEYIEIMDILNTFAQVSGRPPVRLRLPLWLAKAALPFMSLVYKHRGVKPIFSAYSLYTLQANSLFDSAKARRDLGYAPRPIRRTLEDTAAFWLAQREDKGK